MLFPKTCSNSLKKGKSSFLSFGNRAYIYSSLQKIPVEVGQGEKVVGEIARKEVCET